MEWMGSFVQVVHDKIYPYWPRPRGDSELVLVPLISRKSCHWNCRVFLDFPGGVVEVSKGHIPVARHLLDFGVHNECLICFFRQALKSG